MVNRSDRALSDPDISDGCASEPRGRRGESARISMMARCAYVASQRSRIYGSSPDHHRGSRILHKRRESIYGYKTAAYSIEASHLTPWQTGGVHIRLCGNSFRSPRRIASSRIGSDKSPENASTWLKLTPENGARTFSHSLGH